MKRLTKVQKIMTQRWEIVKLFGAGHSVSSLAKDYRVDRLTIEHAIRTYWLGDPCH